MEDISDIVRIIEESHQLVSDAEYKLVEAREIAEDIAAKYDEIDADISFCYEDLANEIENASDIIYDASESVASAHSLAIHVAGDNG